MISVMWRTLTESQDWQRENDFKYKYEDLSFFNIEFIHSEKSKKIKQNIS